MLELLIAFGLSTAQLPGIPLARLYDFGGLHARSNHPSVRFGPTLLGTMMEDPEASASLAFDMLAKRNLVAVTAAIKQYAQVTLERLDFGAVPPAR